MLLATRCPFCETVFRLQPAHLALRRGLVRCGHCHEVFDATSSLFETDASGDLTRSTPVTPEVVAALVAGQPVGEVTATGPGEPHAAVSGAEAGAETSAGAETVEAANTAEPAEAVEAPQQAEARQAAEAHPQNNGGSDTEPHPAHEASHTPLPGRPNFRSESWNPWAPAPDAVIDERLRHTTKNLPYKPLPEAAMAKLRQAIEREAAHRAAQNGSGHAPEHHVDAPGIVEPAHETADDHANAFTQTHDEGNASATANGSSAHASAQVEESANHSAEAGDTLNALADVDDPASIAPAPHERVNGSASAGFHHAMESEHHERTNDSPQASSWRAVEPVSEKDIEPSFGSATSSSSAATLDNEPGFSKPSAEPFAATEASENNEPFAVVRETRPAAPSRLGWRILGTLVALALLVVLGAQLAWWQRETVMVYWPRSQMLFAQACAQLGCTIAPPRDLDGLQLGASELRQVDSPHQLELKMPLRNRFGVSLAYPSVELTLLDAHNNVALRRVLFPKDYVAPGTPVEAGLPAHTTQTMIVRLDTGDAIASNFLVQIFYP